MYFFRISDTMFQKDGITHKMQKEKESVDCAYEKLMAGFDHFMSVMQEDHDKLKAAWEEMTALKV